MQRIQAEDSPTFARYVADEDPAFARTASLTPAEVTREFVRLRQPLIAYLAALTPAQYARTAQHPVYGRFDVVSWTEFFLLHETHHLFTIFRLLGESAYQQPSPANF